MKKLLLICITLGLHQGVIKPNVVVVKQNEPKKKTLTSFFQKAKSSVSERYNKLKNSMRKNLETPSARKDRTETINLFKKSLETPDSQFYIQQKSNNPNLIYTPQLTSDLLNQINKPGILLKEMSSSTIISGDDIKEHKVYTPQEQPTYKMILRSLKEAFIPQTKIDSLKREFKARFNPTKVDLFKDAPEYRSPLDNLVEEEVVHNKDRKNPLDSYYDKFELSDDPLFPQK